MDRDVSGLRRCWGWNGDSLSVLGCHYLGESSDCGQEGVQHGHHVSKHLLRAIEHCTCWLISVIDECGRVRIGNTVKVMGTGLDGANHPTRPTISVETGMPILLIKRIPGVMGLGTVGIANCSGHFQLTMMCGEEMLIVRVPVCQ